MTDKPSHSRIRIIVSQFLLQNDIPLEDLYAALGIDTEDCDPSAVSHIAGVLDGMGVASSRIRQHGLDEWTKS